MDAQARFEQIEAYLLGELSPEERGAFEARLRDDPAFAAEVTRHRELFEAVTDKRAAAFRAKLDAIQARRDAGPSSASVRRSLPRFRLAAAAAAVALILLAGYFLYDRLQRPDTPAGLFALAEERGWTVYPPALFPDVARQERDAARPATAADSLAGAIEKIKAEYVAGRYAEALAALSTLPPDSVGADRFHYYRGLLELRGGRPAEAIASFEQVDPGSRFDEGARWNRALALVSAGRTEEAARIFGEFRDHPSLGEAAEGMIRALGTRASPRR